MFEFFRKHNLSTASFDDWPDDLMIEFLTKINNFFAVRRLADGSVVGATQLLTTVSVCTGIEPLTPFMYRWCFQDPREAKFFYQNVIELDEVPAIDNRTSLVGHRYRREPLLMEYDQFGYAKW